MSRYQPYHLIKRKTKRGKILYQARFLDEEIGKVLCTRSTGQSNKTVAARIAERMLPELKNESLKEPTPMKIDRKLLKHFKSGKVKVHTAAAFELPALSSL